MQGLISSVNALNALGNKSRVLIIAVCGLFASVLFCVPTPFNSISYLRQTDKFKALLTKKNDLLSNLNEFGPETHAAKGIYRLTVPTIMKVFNIDKPITLYRVQVVFGILLYFLAAAILCGIIQDFFAALLVMIALSGTLFAKFFYLDAYPFLDTFGFFFALLCLWGRTNPVVLLLSSIALFYVDERGAICAVMIYVSIKMLELERCEHITLKHLFSIKSPSVFLILGLFIAVALRLYLTFVHHLQTPTGAVGGNVLSSQWMHIQQGLFAGAVGFWALFAITVFHALAHGRWLLAALVTAFILVFVTVSINVYDVTRSFCYVIPLCFVCAKYLYDNVQNINYSFATIAVINTLYPTTFVIQDHIYSNVGYPVYILLLHKIVEHL